MWNENLVLCAWNSCLSLNVKTKINTSCLGGSYIVCDLED